MERALPRANSTGRWAALSARGAVGSGVVLVAIVLSAAFATAAQAAPGDLDATFSTDGKQRTDFLTGRSQAAATVVQPDGKIVAVGYNDSGVTDFALARYNPDGTPDTSFSGDSRQVTDFGGYGVANGVALQSDGKIVVVGQDSRSDFAVARYNPNGSLDTSFSGDGKQTTDFGQPQDAANGVAIQPDGKIVVVGTTGVQNEKGPSYFDSALARYNPDGSLDTSFSGDGEQTIDLGGLDGATGVAVQANGKIVASATSGAAVGFVVVRYNADGSLDLSFHGNGKQRADFGGDCGESASGVALQGDGKIVAVGSAGCGSDFALARFNPTGSFDTTFSDDGKQTTDFGGSDYANEVTIQGDDKIVAAGGGRPYPGDFALARYNPDGSLDPSFSDDGTQTTDFNGDGDVANGVATQVDGKIVAVGQARVGDGSYQDLVLARYSPDGSLDTSFSDDGKQTTRFGGFDEARAMALQADGKIVVVGATGYIWDFALARYNADGSLDTSFSDDGKQTTDLAGFDEARGVAVQPDGKIVVVGWAALGGFALARYNPNGSLDTSFSGDGKQTTDFGFHSGAANGVVLQPDGKIVAVGDGGGGFTIARYNSNGSLDPSFSGDGKQTTSFAAGATGVALQGDGKIVVVGGGGANGDFAIARYNPNGSLDPSFSGDGKQTTDFGGSADGATGVALQANGKIVAVGGRGVGTNGGDFALIRYNPNGSLDPSFSGDGTLTTNFGGGDGASGVALRGNGKIVAVGYTGLGGGDFALARYNPDGALDTSFSGDGKQNTSFGGQDGASGVALQPDGKIVVVGRGFGTDLTSDFALARYLGG